MTNTLKTTTLAIVTSLAFVTAAAACPFSKTQQTAEIQSKLQTGKTAQKEKPMSTAVEASERLAAVKTDDKDKIEKKTN